MAREHGPYSVAFPVDFTSKGDTTRDAFRKHMDEITRIYGILTGLDADTIDSDAVNEILQKHVDSTNPHPNYKPSWANLTNKPSLDDLSGTLTASKVKGVLTNATMASGNVTGLEAFVNSKIPSDSGNGIIGSSLNKNGYVKFKNGFIAQWGQVSLTQDEYNSSRETPHSANFPVKFPTSCFTVIAGTGINADDNNSSDADVVIQVKDITQTGFKYIGQLFVPGASVKLNELHCCYIALGV